MSTAADREIERNYAAFTRQLPELREAHEGEFALLHHEKIEDFFSSAADAVIAGSERFGTGCYSVQQVTDMIENLGFYSYAGSALHA